MMSPVMKNTKSLYSQIERLVNSTGDSNQTVLTLSPEFGWSVSWQPADFEEDAVSIISKDSLNEWASGHEWDEHQIQLAAEFITANIGDWLRNDERPLSAFESHI